VVTGHSRIQHLAWHLLATNNPSQRSIYAESLMSVCGVVDIENLQAGTRGTNGAIC